MVTFNDVQILARFVTVSHFMITVLHIYIKDTFLSTYGIVLINKQKLETLTKH